MKKLISIAICALCFAGQTMAQNTKQKEILDVVKRTNDYFMKKYSDPTLDTYVNKARTSNLWTRAVYYEGLMALYEIDPQQRYIDYTDRWADYHKWTARGSVKDTDADNQCCQQTYIDRYIQSGGKKDLSKVKENLDHQISTGRNNYWTWIDAIQMAMPGFAMMSNITGDSKYIDYAMRSYTWSRDTCGGKLFNTEEGLWWRDANFVAPYKESDGQNCYWSRGNGWVFTALCRTMNQLSPKNKYYKQLKADYMMMANALLKIQREDGFWNASLTSQDFAGPELSGTAQFLYGLCWGVNHGYLKKKAVMPAIHKAWKAVASTVHKDGFVGYVQGSGDRPASSQPVGYNREPDFDDYGLGCLLLGASEYCKLLKD